MSIIFHSHLHAHLLLQRFCKLFAIFSLSSGNLPLHVLTYIPSLSKESTSHSKVLEWDAEQRSRDSAPGENCSACTGSVWPAVPTTTCAAVGRCCRNRLILRLLSTPEQAIVKWSWPALTATGILPPPALLEGNCATCFTSIWACKQTSRSHMHAKRDPLPQKARGKGSRLPQQVKGCDLKVSHGHMTSKMPSQQTKQDGLQHPCDFA